MSEGIVLDGIPTAFRETARTLYFVRYRCPCGWEAVSDRRQKARRTWADGVSEGIPAMRFHFMYCPKARVHS